MDIINITDTIRYIRYIEYIEYIGLYKADQEDRHGSNHDRDYDLTITITTDMTWTWIILETIFKRPRTEQAIPPGSNSQTAKHLPHGEPRFHESHAVGNGAPRGSSQSDRALCKNRARVTLCSRTPIIIILFPRLDGG